MPYLLALALIVVLAVWDKFFRKRRDGLGPGRSADALEDSDRGHRQ